MSLAPETETDPRHPRARFTQPPGRRLNVLLLVSDQERGWDLYPDGYVDAHTPARAWMRDNGVSFVRHHTPTPLCSTARGVLYSGVHSMNNGLWENAPILYATPMGHHVPTLGTAFRDAGYITGYAGKWHLSPMSVTPDAEQKQAIGHTIRSYGFMETDVTEESDGALTGWQHDARTVRQTLDFVRRRETDDAPWFLAVNLLNPHDIMFYTSGDAMTNSRVSAFPDRSERPPIEDPLYSEDLGYDLFENYGPATYGTRPSAVTEYHLTFSESMGYLDYDDLDAGREMQNYYWNCTRDSDRHLAVLLDGLREMDVLDDTIIVLTSDHGELLGAHGMRGKGTLSARESATVPTVVVHPHGRKGEECAALTSHIDLMPTLVAMAGVNIDELRTQLPMVVGQDFSPFVFDAEPKWSRNDGILLHWTAILFQDHRNVARFQQIRHMDATDRPAAVVELMDTSLRKRGQMRGVYDGRWKFQRYCAPHRTHQPTTFDALIASHEIELYDTFHDPG
jgi:arylsulfatase A-like enzyme